MKYVNPIIRGFNPDPSICRVGEDYYFVTSSFEYFPAIPIYHSKDLVNWKHIGNCINRSSQLSLEHATDSGGIWAPTIRYFNNTFYVTATLQNYGNFIVSTNDIYGDWSDPVWVHMKGIDPSIYFEDSKVYYCTNQSLIPNTEGITLAEIDITTGELLNEGKTIWCGIGGGFLEAPHIYHIGEWYYLLAAEGGTNFNHMVTIARSKSIWGEYNSCPDNPILTNRHDTSKEVQCSGHSDMIEDHNGNWWMIHLGIRLARRTMSHLGRETFLTPIHWEDEWPVVFNNRLARLNEEGPLWSQQENYFEWNPGFWNKKWEPNWLFLRKYKENSYKKGNGVLLLYPSTDMFNERSYPTFVGVRQLDFASQYVTSFSYNTEQLGDEAGLIMYLASNYHYRIGKRKIYNNDYIVVEKKAEDFEQTVYKEKIPDGKINIKLIADKEYYYFYYSIGESELKYICKASTRFLSCEIFGKCFTGTVIGIYALCETRTSAIARFDQFSCKRIIE